MIFASFPPSDGTYQLEPHIMLDVRRRPTPTEARACIRVYVSGFVEGKLTVKTRSLSVHTQEQLIDRIDEARLHRSEFLRSVNKDDIFDQTEIDRIKEERRKKAEELAKMTAEQRKEAEAKRLLIVTAPARSDVDGVLSRYGRTNAIEHTFKQFQWIA